MKKIAVITETRADFGLYEPVLKNIAACPQLNLDIIAVGMHLSEEFGYTVKEIEKSGFKISARLGVLNSDDSQFSMADSIGKSISKISKTLARLKPDILLILGDRGEMLAGAVSATYMGIPIAHIHGGDISGNVDEPVRHAITKLSHLHFAATKESAKRIIKMGEEPWRVHVVGAPGLDSIMSSSLEPEEMAEKYHLNLTEPIILVVQHSVVSENEAAGRQICETMEAIKELGLQAVVIYPNADAGGRKMIKVIEGYERYPFIKTFKSLPRKDYLSFMKISTMMVGNSSSGIIEAPAFNLPVINIGTRQTGRQKVGTLINVDYDKTQIKAKIQQIIQKSIQIPIKNSENPYGNGKAGERIANILSEVKIDKKLIEKRMTY